MLYYFIERVENLQIFYYETSELDQVAWQDGSYWLLIPNTFKKTLTLTVFNQQQKYDYRKKSSTEEIGDLIFFFSENFLKGLRNNGSPCKTRENK